jgi:glycosyltransferase involved in cell wall biosynthesis
LARVPVVLATRRELLDLRGKWQQRAVRVSCWLATGVVANSRAAATSLFSERHNGSKVTIIPNSVDRNEFRSTVSPAEIRRELGLREGVPLVGVLASLRPEKDLQTFLGAAARVGKEMPEAQFLVIGDGTERSKLEQCAFDLGLSDRILFLGDRTEVANLLAALDVFVLSSLSESLPNAALEAMTMGRPVVATNVGGMPELVVDGETGYLVPSRDTEAMARRILELLRNPERRCAMGQAGLERARQHFSSEVIKIRLESLYDRLLRERRPTGRILQIGNYPPPVCGWSLHTESVQRALLQRGVDARVLDIGPGRHVRKPGCIRVRNGFDYAAKLLAYRLRGFRFQPHVNGDSWKGYTLALAAILIGRLTGEPAVLMFHAGVNQLYFPRKRGFWRHAFKLLFSASGDVICNFEPVRQAILGYGIPAAKIHPIFSVQYLTENIPVPLPEAVDSFLRAHKPRLFSYALFRPEFTTEALFEAFADLRREYPRAGLLIAGPREVPHEAEEQMRHLGIESSVLLPGNLSHPEFLTAVKRSDVFVRTPLGDGLCASVIEALSLRVPVVAAENNLRPPSVITYKPGDSADLKLKLSRVLSDLERATVSVCPPETGVGLEAEISLLLAESQEIPMRQKQRDCAKQLGRKDFRAEEDTAS